MIDKIKLTLPRAALVKAGQDIAGRLKNYRRQDINTGTGTIGNMAVHQNLDGVTIRGSIAKYLHGENIRPLTRKSVQAAIEKLEEDTGLSLGEAVLCSVEVGTSVILKEKPAEFMRLFGEAARYTKTVHSRNGFIETVLYGTSTGAYAFCVYDKGREMAAKGQAPPPPLFSGCNVLRLEYRILRRQGIRPSLGRDLTAYDLFDYEVYRKLQALFLGGDSESMMSSQTKP